MRRPLTLAATLVFAAHMAVLAQQGGSPEPATPDSSAPAKVASVSGEWTLTAWTPPGGAFMTGTISLTLDRSKVTGRGAGRSGSGGVSGTAMSACGTGAAFGAFFCAS